MTERIRSLFYRMIEFDRGDPDLIQHFTKVYSYASLIAQSEQLEAHLTEVLEAAALVHDIAIPLCNRKYGSHPGNLQEVLPTAGMEHSGLDIIANNNVKLNVDFFVVNYPKRTWIEYLIKAGLYRLVKDITDGLIWGGAYGIEYGTSLQECLGIDGAGVNRMKQTNGGLATLAWLKTEKETGKMVGKFISFLKYSKSLPFSKAINAFSIRCSAMLI